MHSTLWCAYRRVCPLFSIATLACAFTLVAHAQAPGNVRLDPTPTLQATRASTAVPAVVYRSVFAGLPQGMEDPALDWKAANATVGQYKRGHIDLLKWEQEQARKAAPAAAGVAP